MNLPNFSFEKALWKKGFRFVAGADEVGRGAFAGPVVASCVVFPNNLTIEQFSNEGILINDSKKLRPRQREIASKWIKKNVLTWGIGECPTSVINRLGMAKATKMAFRKALSVVCSQLAVDYLLVDAFYVPFTKGIRHRNQLAIIKGDTKSISIAAASIVAKVHRDKIMLTLSKKYTIYGWGRNKGYGTLDHRRAIERFGITKLHRKQFVKGF